MLITNPKAFPLEKGNRASHQRGMDLRDYFAAKAMQMFFDPESLRAVNKLTDNPAEGIAKGAYEIADAMLKESRR